MRVNGISISDLWLPARAIGPAAKFGSRGVSHDLARFGIEIDGVACAPGDVAQVTQQGAPLAVLDFRVQLLAFTDAREHDRPALSQCTDGALDDAHVRSTARRGPARKPASIR